MELQFLASFDVQWIQHAWIMLWAKALLHSSWQVCSVGLLFAIVRWFLPSSSAGLRYVWAFTCLMACVAWPVGAFITSVRIVEEATHGSTHSVAIAPPAVSSTFAATNSPNRYVTIAVGTASQFDSATLAARLRNWTVDQLLSAVFVLWICGLGISVIRYLLGSAFLFWLRRQCEPIEPPLKYSVERIRHHLQLSSRVAVKVSRRVSGAFVSGLVRPMVIVPAAWETELTPEMFAAVVAHELAHIRRYDLWANAFQHAAETVMYFHPVVWWISAEVRHEREKCCDLLAADAIADRTVYAQTLEFLATNQATPGRRLIAAVPLGGKPMRMLDRVQHVLGRNASQYRLAPWSVAMLLTATILSANLASHWSTASAQEDAERTEPRDDLFGSPDTSDLFDDDGYGGDDDLQFADTKRQRDAAQKRSAERARSREETPDKATRKKQDSVDQYSIAARGKDTIPQEDVISRLLDTLRRLEQKVDHQSKRLDELEQRLGDGRNATAGRPRNVGGPTNSPAMRNRGQMLDELRRQHERLSNEREERLRLAMDDFGHRAKLTAAQHESREQRAELESQLVSLKRKRAQVQLESELQALELNSDSLKAKMAAAAKLQESDPVSDGRLDELHTEYAKVRSRIDALRKNATIDEEEHDLQMKARQLQVNAELQAAAREAEAEHEAIVAEISQKYAERLRDIEAAMENLEHERPQER